jgi:lathosterol oxidase
MDWVLSLLDEHVLDGVYDAVLPLTRDSLLRQSLSTYTVGLLGGSAIYFTFSTLDYVFLFDKRLLQHKQALPNQVRQEIACASYALVVMALLSVPIWLLEVRGYAKLYSSIDEYGWPYLLASVAGFLVFTDTCIYWIHRWFHHPAVYPYVHKEHHKWKVPTPYASIAFHPVDGWSQALPYHVFVFLFPMQRHIYLALFVMVQIWSVSIHDQVYVTNHTLAEKFINGADHHTEHHLKFNYNYGQFFTFWDWAMGTYLKPTESAIHPPPSMMTTKKKD